MRLLKAMLVVACIASAISVFRPIVPPGGPVGIFLGMVDTVLFGGAFYGIHRRAPLMWKLGFAIILFLGASFLTQSLTMTWNTLGRAPNARIEAAFISVAALAVTTYWLVWWKRQKAYFVNSSL